jgi:hypothetical protein
MEMCQAATWIHEGLRARSAKGWQRRLQCGSSGGSSLLAPSVMRPRGRRASSAN